MQSVGRGLRYVGPSSTALRAIPLHHPVASSSCATLGNVRYYAARSPFQWLRDNLAMSVRRKNTAKEIAVARKEQTEKGQLSVFETLPTAKGENAGGGGVAPVAKKKHTQHKYSTGNFKISHRKLNMLGRQISGKPIDSAVLQMMFSEKRASKRIKSMLAVAKDHAKLKGLDEKKLIVAEAWVTKGPHVVKRIDIKGRGRFGIKEHPDSRMHVVLKEGKTKTELLAEERARKLKRIVSAGIVREDVPLRNPGPAWAW
ncbi:mitochondrial 50S ribosomal protein L22 [Sparassis latifolia]|uniref:Candidate mitochondrial 50S ribosomal protein n=1 Tax=Sparassis crispa TaxID=139825 RepID=A0A401GBS7_9APHY|nr:candidate mitochondrial 50S ribosomal protein [Sparassis crispa]GBE79630.1 candidate mitochondrial 50S ribosomal protein [Sparassis crispa]